MTISVPVSQTKTISAFLPGWLVAVLLCILIAALAPVAGGMARPVFVLGCLAVSAYAWRQGPGAHVQAMLVLFAFAPFLRRFVDVNAGFEAGGLMLVGPLLALLVPFPRLIAFLDGHRSPLSDGMAPVTVIFACVGYAACISAFQGAWVDAAAGALKWVAPLVYAAVLIATGERRTVVDAATNAYMFVLPVIGLYGVFQYLDPPEWDRYWMQFAVAVTAGLPLPYEIRVFSTLNGPASFATFTAIGILLVTMLRPVWASVIFCGPAALALLLSQYRTAWLSLGLGLLFCLLFSGTRARAGMIFGAMFLGGMFALAIPGFSDALIDRVQTLGDGSDDGSLQGRLEQFVLLWNQPDSSLFGIGFTTGGDAGVAGAMAVDGMLIACWLTMGLVFGAVCVAAFVWACCRTMVNAWRSSRRDAVALGALGCGALLHIPLASLASGELGFMFWTFAAVACVPDEAERRW